MNEIIRSLPYYKGVTRELKSPNRSTGVLTYTPGETVEADGLDEDPALDCGRGVNFVSTIAEALKWGPIVVELTVPDGDRIIDAGNKLRARRVVVGTQIDLSRANLSRANLYGADLYGADLSRADLSRANLYGANLYGANLYGANLSRADLSRANLYGANLYGANLSRADLSRAKTDDYTVLSGLPSGWIVKNGIIQKEAL